MGYEISLMDQSFYIAKENINGALCAINKTAEEFKEKYSYNIEIHSHIYEAFNYHSYHVAEDNDGNIIDINYESYKLRDEFEFLFKPVALFVKDGSYIQMLGEDGQMFRWVFNNGVCEEIYPKIVW